HRPADRNELVGAPRIARERDLRVVKDAVRVQEAADSPKRGIERISAERVFDLRERLLRGRPRRQLELRQQYEGGAGWKADVVLPIGAVLVKNLNTSAIHMLDCGD